jgi:hypothetical protein
MITRDELIAWMRFKLDATERSLATRLEMARTLRSGESGFDLTAADRLREADFQDRIADMMQRDVTMWRAALDAIARAEVTAAEPVPDRARRTLLKIQANTAVDLSPITEAERLAAIRKSEAEMLRAYRKQDAAHYSRQTKPGHVQRRR